ncbi:Histone-lysine N-methyltransferase [Phytophthora palmivora]|uniref:Histone-lysine N-methyltransferase n=1 Tax=Phytophthora palmivora TaxID=4796 RepID=A0A2P4YKC2_9STRA|nr:Histone-lysine N-methyltransferase [Phytophthora palmivora]
MALSPDSTSFDQLQALRNVQLIERNEYPLKHLAQEKVRRRARAEDEDDDDGALCFCSLPDAMEREEAAHKGEELRRCDDVSCLNFATYVECSPSCGAGQYCRNQRLQHPEQYPHLEPFKTEFKGYGVRTTQEIAQLSIVGEYVGEIIDQKELARRQFYEICEP